MKKRAVCCDWFPGGAHLSSYECYVVNHAPIATAFGEKLSIPSGMCCNTCLVRLHLRSIRELHRFVLNALINLCTRMVGQGVFVLVRLGRRQSPYSLLIPANIRCLSLFENAGPEVLQSHLHLSSVPSPRGVTPPTPANARKLCCLPFGARTHRH